MTEQKPTMEDFEKVVSIQFDILNTINSLLEIIKEQNVIIKRLNEKIEDKNNYC